MVWGAGASGEASARKASARRASARRASARRASAQRASARHVAQMTRLAAVTRVAALIHLLIAAGFADAIASFEGCKIAAAIASPALPHVVAETDLGPGSLASLYSIGAA